jgi:hypothetical protein
MVEMMKVHREQFGWFKENINLRIIKCHLGNYIQEIEIQLFGNFGMWFL